MQKVSNKKGFTLIELLIVISIIGILAVVLLPTIVSAPATARDAGRKATINSVLAGLEQYKAAAGNYPDLGTNGGCLEAVPGIANYFKGDKVPTGAKISTIEKALGCSSSAKASAKIAYCKLATNNQGYSYVVAIRMEQPQLGANGMDPTTAPSSCSALVSGGDYIAPSKSTTPSKNMWYYMVQ